MHSAINRSMIVSRVPKLQRSTFNYQLLTLLLCHPTSLVTILALIVYFAVTLNVGRARLKYQIKPPAMTGSPDFERVIRVQQNTLEQLILFIPALWVFSYFVSPVWGAGIGAVWILGRILFAWGYYQAAERTMGIWN